MTNSCYNDIPKFAICNFFIFLSIYLLKYYFEIYLLYSLALLNRVIQYCPMFATIASLASIKITKSKLVIFVYYFYDLYHLFYYLNNFVIRFDVI